MTYWIKPIGSSENPIDQNKVWSPSNVTIEQHFAQRPVGVKTGDILITYAVGYQLVEGIYEVVGNTFRVATPQQKQKEPWRNRYPYIWDTKNILQQYSDEWAIHRLNLFDLEKLFLEQGGIRITPKPNKNTTKGAIQAQKDKMKITKEFAEFVEKEMRKCIKLSGSNQQI